MAEKFRGIPKNAQEVQEFIRSWPVYARDVDDPNFKPQEEIVAIQNQKLVKQLELVKAGSRYFNELFRREKIDWDKIRTIDDLKHVPVTTKLQYMEDPEAFKLELPNRTIYDTIYTTTYTSGTAYGRPTPFYNTAHDVFGWMYVMGIRGFKISYLTPEDRVYSAFPVAPLPHIGYLNLPFMFACTGGYWGAGFGGVPYPDFPLHNSTEEVLNRMEAARPTCVMGIASFLRRLFRIADQQGRDLSTIMHVWAAGEAAPKGLRDDIRQSLQNMGAGEVFVNNGFGFTEASVQWSECYELGRLHNPDPTMYYMEVVDPNTFERLPDGELGLLTITHLNRRGTVYIRQAIGDIAAITHEPCPHCGRTGDAIIIKVGSTYASRTTDLLKIKGELINPETLKDVIAKTDGVIEYQIVITKDDPSDPYSMDKLLFRVALEKGDREVVRDDLINRTYNAAMIRPQIEFVDNMNDLFDPLTEFKPRRVIDNRPKE